MVIVGAGPAGLAAAIEARRLGVDVLVIDEYARAGGQFYKQPAYPLTDQQRHTLPPQVKEGMQLAARAASMGVKFWFESQVWGLFPGLRLGVVRGSISTEVVAQRLIIACGAHERCIAFPGWTLPGVITPGAAQTLIKAHSVLPGRRTIVAGSGPFLLAVAAQLLKTGAEVVTYVEAAPWSWATLSRFTTHPSRWGELARYVWPLLRARIAPRLRTAVIAAHGKTALSAVTLASLDSHGRPMPETKRQIEVDTLAVGYGFRPSCELTTLAGCAHQFSETAGGRYCVVDRDTGETNVEGVYAAGEVTGIGGARAAFQEGRIAGLSVASSLKHWDDEASQRLHDTRLRRRREQKFADLVSCTFAPPLGLAEFITDNTVICRCEEVSGRAVREAVTAGAHTATAIKMWTRCGMGRCQGRMCGWSIGRYVAALTGSNVESIGISQPRIPIKPVKLQHVLATNPD